MELRKRMHDPIAKTGAWVNQMLQRVPELLCGFRKPARACGGTSTRCDGAGSSRSSDAAKRAFVAVKFLTSITARFFPSIRILHPLPCHRFDARTQGTSPVR